jgi:ubiquinone/menaquinone biosynthesis C-methylase UbiE
VETPGADYWDACAETFDQEPDHGLRDPALRAAWAGVVLPPLPPPPARVADIGCGTGTLSVLMALAGYAVCGLDLSMPMLAEAERKAASAGLQVTFVQADASQPPYASGSFDAVVVRHVLWALPDQEAAVERWAGLLTPGGVLELVEGCWCTGAGVSATRCEQLALRHFPRVCVRRLEDPALWGRTIDDERFLVVATKAELR